MTDDRFLRRTFQLAVDARSRGDHPFGALLVVDGVVVAEALNKVVTSADITAHAETALVRQLEDAGQLPRLAAGTVFASCEPCPMCVGALFWAGVRRVVFGLSSARLATLATPPDTPDFGFTITAGEIGARAEPKMQIIGPRLEEEAAGAHVGFWFTA